jgi:membrane protease YdiL (CAAX protease family)
LDAAGVVPQVLEIAKRARTGTLEVRRGQVVKMVMFHGGRPLDVRSNDPAERLGEVLVTHRRIDRAQQSKALALSQSEGCFFGEALVKLGVLTGQQLTEFLHSQAVVRFNDLLGWTSGTYRFDAAGAVDPAGAVLREGALELCRQFLTPSRGFALDRVTTWLGDTKLALEKGSQWLVGSEAMSPADLKVVRALSSGKPLTFNGLMAELEKAGLKRPEALVAVFLLAAGHVASVTAGVPEPAGDGGGEVSDLASVMATDEADKVLEEIKGRLWGKSIYRILNVGPSTPPDKLDELLDGVHDEVAKLTLGRPETSDARAYLFARIEDLKRHASDPLERSIELRAHVMGVDPSDPATHELLEAECLGNVVAENIARGKFKDVFSHSEREATLRPDDPLAVSHWGLCQALGSDDPKVKKAGAVMLLEAAEKYPKSLDVLCAGVRACAAAGQPGAAKRLLKLAEALAPKDTKVQQAAVALSEVRSAGKAAGAAGGVDAVVVPGAVLKVVGVALGFYALIGVPGVVLNAGSKEYYYTGDDPFWYVRHLLLVVFALLGARVAASEGPKDFFTRLGFAAKPGPLVLALLIGVASGWISPFQNVKGAAGTVIGLTVAHVVAEQLFFNGLLVRTFMGSLSRKSTILMAMAMFAAYHATYVSFIRWQTMEWIPYSLAAVAVGGALPYAALYVYSGSILPPLLCHLACNLTMMGYSLATRGVAVVP